MPEEKNQWWGYKHVSGTYQAKRYWPGERSSKLAMDDAFESDFVDQVVSPFFADTRDEALAYVKQHTI